MSPLQADLEAAITQAPSPARANFVLDQDLTRRANTFPTLQSCATPCIQSLLPGCQVGDYSCECEPNNLGLIETDGAKCLYSACGGYEGEFGIASELGYICFLLSVDQDLTGQATEETTTTAESTASTTGDTTQTGAVVTRTNSEGSLTTVTSAIYTAASTNSSGGSGGSSGLSTGATAGIAVGTALGGIALCVIAFLLYKFCIKKQLGSAAPFTAHEVSTAPTTGPTAELQGRNLSGARAGGYQSVSNAGPVKQGDVHLVSLATAPSPTSAVPIPPPGYPEDHATELHANAYPQPTELQARQGGGMSPAPARHSWAGYGQQPPVPPGGVGAMEYAQPVRSEMVGDVHVRPELQGQPYIQVRPELQGQSYEQVRPELHGRSYGQGVYEMPTAAEVVFPPGSPRSASGNG